MINLLDVFPTIKLDSTNQEPEFVLNPWEIKEDDFPFDGTTTDKLKFLLNYAVLAPSIHNIPPGLFKIVDDAIELYADTTRALPVANPDYREPIISCGAALFHLRLAIRYFGYKDLVEILPERHNRSWLARIRFGSRRITQLEEKFLFRAIPRLDINPLSFKDCQIPKSLKLELESAADAECINLHITAKVIPQAFCPEVINLIDLGDRLQTTDSLFGRELAQWIDSESAQNCQLPIPAPVLMLISSDGDRPHSWLATGEALAHLLLRARVDGVWASFLNQPIQVPQLRSRLKALFPENGHPQILLRLGYAQDTKPTARRSRDEVM